MRKFIILILSSFYLISLSSQPILVKDFTLGTKGSFNKEEYKGIKLNDGFIIPITSLTKGTELGYVDLTGIKILKDINIGLESSNPKNLIAYKGKVYFTAIDEQNGTAIWSTNGTEAGTKLEVALGGFNKTSSLILSKSNKLYFTYDSYLYAYDGNTLKELASFDKYEQVFCTYNNDIAYTKRENNALAIYTLENGVFKKKGAVANGIGTSYDSYGMNQVAGGIIIGINERSNPNVTGTYLLNNDNVTSKIFSGAKKRAIRLEKIDENRVFAAVDSLGLYALDGTIAGNKLFYESNAISFTVGDEFYNITYRDKILFMGQVDGFFEAPKLFYSDGTKAGTEVLFKLFNSYNSNIIREGNYAFFATNTSNGWNSSIYSLNLDSGKETILHNSELPSTPIDAVIMLGVIGKRLYFYSALDPAVGRELYYLNLDIDITDVKDINITEEAQIKLYDDEFEIISVNSSNVEISVHTIAGSLIESRNIKTNTRYKLPKSCPVNILSTTINGRILNQKYYSN